MSNDSWINQTIYNTMVKYLTKSDEEIVLDF